MQPAIEPVLPETESDIRRSDRIEHLLQRLECHDLETHAHCERVGAIAGRIAAKMGLSRAEIKEAIWGGKLHDLGKLEIPLEILNKPGKLTPDERTEIERHPLEGFLLLRSIDGLDEAKQAVLHHHERFDGTGYPLRLRGEEIPLLARICTVADVWDALVSDRPYKKGWEKARALKFINEHAGDYFDPKVVEAFLRVAINLPSERKAA